MKVVIDAYNGTITFYVFDPSDPLIQVYEKIYPGMFKPASAMPVTLQQHVRYPEDFFATQAQMFATYHVTDPSLLYNKGNQWELPSNLAISGSAPMSPYYMIMRLPGQTREEFTLVVPFVPNGRSNMIAWLGAESDMPNYGRAVSSSSRPVSTYTARRRWKPPSTKTQQSRPSATLWGQQGSTVIFGNLLTVPIEQLAALRAAAVLQSSQTKLPQIQRIIVFYRSPSPRIPELTVRAAAERSDGSHAR